MTRGFTEAELQIFKHLPVTLYDSFGESGEARAEEDERLGGSTPRVPDRPWKAR